MATKILVVEDEIEIVRLVRTYLQQADYQVLVAYNGSEGLRMAKTDHPDLIVLDLMLPEMNGLDVCRSIRRESDVPIIMLTARVEEIDRLIGLELGADDYITKPFSPRELVARVRAVLRRTQGSPATVETLTLNDVTLNASNRTVRIRGKSVELTAMEFDLLATLMKHPGRVFTRLQLLDQVQGHAYDGYERTIDTHIKNLRRKIEATPRKPEYVLTAHGVGYKFRDNA